MGVRGRVIGLAVVVVLAGCSSTPHPVPQGPRFDNGEVRFTAPTGWVLGVPLARSYGPPVTWLSYLANQPLRDDCSGSDSEFVCRHPVDRLRQGGMLVTWIVEGCLAQSCALPAGRALTVGNRQGVRVAPQADSCAEVAATYRWAYYVTVTPQRIDILFVCARNPTAATKSALLGFLDAIVWRIP